MATWREYKYVVLSLFRGLVKYLPPLYLRSGDRQALTLKHTLALRVFQAPRSSKLTYLALTL
eukprot:6913829-Pyramimonas_sp.AAC.1